MKKIKVLAIPAKINKDINPYNYILYSSLEAQGVSVIEYNLKSLLQVRSYDIVHIHWPENFLDAYSRLRSFRALLVFCAKLIFLKLFNKKLVWTVHNFKPHENSNTGLAKILYKILYKYANGFINLTNFGAHEVMRLHKVPKNKIAVIPHPHYVTYYKNSISKYGARNILGIPPDKFVFLFIGQVRTYKNVVSLVHAFNALNCPGSILVIAGKVHDEISVELKGAISGNNNIKSYPYFIDDDKLQLYLNCADLVVNPFLNILNSGSVFLNLSYYRPTLVPDTSSLVELQTQVGAKWIKTYKGNISAEHLKNSMEEIMASNNQDKPDLSAFSWQKIASYTKSFYQSLLS